MCHLILGSKKRIRFFLLLFYILFQSNTGIYGQSIFQNDICLPGTLYMLEGIQNDIFVEPLIKRWRPYNDVVRFSGTTEFTRRLQRVASIANPIEGEIIQLDLVNQDEFKTIKTLTSEIVVGKPNSGNDSITISIIGDSFTNGAFFKDALLERGIVPMLKMIGIRDVKGHSGQFDEGRGGWTLNSYFSVTNKRTQAHNGFWQPEGNFQYWGATAFWQLAVQVHSNPEKDWSFSESYNAGRFATQSLLFDPETGYKANPKKNDLMYDNESDQYVLFDGAKWEKVTYEEYEWSFDYGKYLSMWKLEKPLILAEFLGLNDFRNMPDPSNIDFSKWNGQMEILIDSYLKAVPTGKFVLMIPSSTCGILDNKAGDFTTKQNACMWEARRNIIEKFDKRTEEQIYIVDAGIAIDNLNGTQFLTDSDSTFTKPYSAYVGEDSIAVQTGNPHPYPNYPTMGISLAAFIQNFREELTNGKGKK